MTKKIFYGILVGVGAALMALLFSGTASLKDWENVTWSWRVRYFAKPAESTTTIKLVVIDQDSLDWFKKKSGYGWPWPRELYKDILNYCKRSGAKAVIFDITFTEPSVFGAGDDAALEQAIRGGPPFIGTVSVGHTTGEHTSWPEKHGRKLMRIEGLDRWTEITGIKPASRAIFPIPEVAGTASILGNVFVDPDPDGTVRRVGLFRVFDGRAVPSLAVAAYWFGTEPPVQIERGELRIGEKIIPIDDRGRVIPRFRGPPGTHEKIRASAVLQSEWRINDPKPGEAPPIKDKHIFKDCYVILGGTAPGLYDVRSAPIGEVGRIYPGLEFHATLLDNLLANDFLRDAPRWAVVLSTLLLAIAGGAAMVLSKRAWHSIAAFIVFLPLPAVLGFAAYYYGFWWPIVIPGCALTISLVGGVVFNYATEGRQRSFITHTFGHYLSPAVINQILTDPSRLRLGGERRELSIMFTDLEGFTSISKHMDPHKLTQLLNEYLSDMTDIILDEGGTLDKYEGDAIIAFWNAPLEQPDHALRACRAALRCQEKLTAREAEFKARIGKPLRMRIGINTGAVIVGNMGSRRRFDYTVIGDSANLASRLEGANKMFGTSIMVAESTLAQTGGRIAAREIGLLRVVGREDSVKVYELIGLAGAVETEAVKAFARGLGCCRGGRWAEALQIFEALKDDPVAAMYAGRCQTLKDPEARWDGIWNLTQK